MKQKPALLLFPNLLGENQHHEVFLPASVDKAVASIDGLIAESDRAGRRYLGRFKLDKDHREIPIAICNQDTPDEDLDFLLEPIHEGERWGFVSDCGMPCIADPGAKLVRHAKQKGVVVQAFVGPSSIFLALMLSGLSGQSFAFNGYLNKDPETRVEQIKELEKKSEEDGSTQIFMETPFRNKHTLQSLVDTLDDSTYLCVAWELTLPDQGVLSQPVRLWKKSPLPNLDKRNALFLINVN